MDEKAGVYATCNLYGIIGKKHMKDEGCHIKMKDEK